MPYLRIWSAGAFDGRKDRRPSTASAEFATGRNFGQLRSGDPERGALGRHAAQRDRAAIPASGFQGSSITLPTPA